MSGIPIPPTTEQWRPKKSTPYAGQGEKRDRPSGVADLDRSLALCSVLQENPEAHRRRLLVLLEADQDDPVARAPPLQESRPCECEGRGVGREEPGGCPGAISQSRVGKAVCKAPRAHECWTHRGRRTALEPPGWITGDEKGGRPGSGLICFFLCFLSSFLFRL